MPLFSLVSAGGVPKATVNATTTDPDFTGTFNNVSLTFNSPNGFLDDIAVDSNFYYLQTFLAVISI